MTGTILIDPVLEPSANLEVMHERLLAAATLRLDDLPNELLEIIER